MRIEIDAKIFSAVCLSLWGHQAYPRGGMDRLLIDNSLAIATDGVVLGVGRVLCDDDGGAGSFSFAPSKGILSAAKKTAAERVVILGTTIKVFDKKSSCIATDAIMLYDNHACSYSAWRKNIPTTEKIALGKMGAFMPRILEYVAKCNRTLRTGNVSRWYHNAGYPEMGAHLVHYYGCDDFYSIVMPVMTQEGFTDEWEPF